MISLFFCFQKIPKSNPFDLVNPKIQRFYFNNNSGNSLLFSFSALVASHGSHFVQRFF